MVLKLLCITISPHLSIGIIGIVGGKGSVNLFIKKFLILTVPFLFQIFLGNKTECSGVDAETSTGKCCLFKFFSMNVRTFITISSHTGKANCSKHDGAEKIEIFTDNHATNSYFYYIILLKFI